MCFSTENSTISSIIYPIGLETTKNIQNKDSNGSLNHIFHKSYASATSLLPFYLMVAPQELLCLIKENIHLHINYNFKIFFFNVDLQLLLEHIMLV